MTTADPAQIAVSVVSALEGAGISCAIGGALCYAYYGDPRATRDVDLNVFVTGAAIRRALVVLKDAGVTLEVERDAQLLTDRGDARAWMGDVPIHVFCNSIPLHESAMQRTKRVPLLGREVSILAAEDLVTLKMLFFRAKDLVDVEKLLRVQDDRCEASRRCVCSSRVKKSSRGDFDSLRETGDSTHGAVSSRRGDCRANRGGHLPTISRRILECRQAQLFGERLPEEVTRTLEACARIQELETKLRCGARRRVIAAFAFRIEPLAQGVALK